MFQVFVARGVIIAALLFITGCNQAPPPAATPYQPVTDIHHTMELILDPATDVIWDSAGSIITAEGERDLAPTTDEGWHKVEQAAAVVAETGNLLMMPGRAAGDDWVKYSSDLVEAGTLALQAAQDQDSDALFDAGGRMYQVCLACHTQYWVEVDSTND
jgi:hypothetical protein